MEISEDPKIKQWYGLNESSKNTITTYNHFIKVFCECVTKTPSELVDEAIGEMKQGLLPSERKIGSYISIYKQCMATRGYSPKSTGLGITAVLSFFKAFDIPVPSSAARQKRRLSMKENQNFLSREDIIKLIANAPSLREKAIILCMTSGGLARQEILSLRMNQIQFDESGVGVVDIRRQKSQVDYTTFLSPEAVSAIRLYFEERDRSEKTKIKSKKDFVFVRAQGGQLNSATFLKNFYLLGIKLGFDNGDNFIKSRSHALRKYFATTLENAGFPKNRVDFMLGHSPSGNDRAYFDHDLMTLKNQYIKFLPYLTFEKTIEIRSLNTEDAKKLEELTIEHQKDKQENELLKQKVASMESMKSEMDIMKVQMANLMAYVQKDHEDVGFDDNEMSEVEQKIYAKSAVKVIKEGKFKL